VLRAGVAEVWRARSTRVTVAGGLACLVLGVLIFRGAPTDRQRLYFVERLDDLLGFILTAIALVVAWTLAARERHDDFPLLKSSRWRAVLPYAAGRSGAAIVAYVSVAVALATVVELAWLSDAGPLPAQQAVHVAVIAVDALPVLLAGLWLGALVQPVAGQALALLLVVYAGDAEVDYAHATLGRLPPGLVERFVRAEHWFLPRMLVDPLKLTLLRNEALLVNQVPGDQGPVLWSDQVVLVSSAADLLYVAAYAVALVLLYALAVRRRMLWIQSREPLRPFPVSRAG